MIRSLPTPRTLLTGLAMVESARWHDGRLWFSGWINLVEPDGTYRQVAGGIEFPNGMVVTPDGSTLVVAESFAGRLSAFDICEDGALTDRRVWAQARRYRPPGDAPAFLARRRRRFVSFLLRSSNLGI